MGAIPFGGGYRMVDFPLSSMTKAGIRNINIIAHHNYESLAEHIGSDDPQPSKHEENKRNLKHHTERNHKFQHY